MRILIDEAPEVIDLARVLTQISPARRALALQYRQPLDRKLSVAAYLLLKRGLRELYGLTENPILVSGPNGKPFLRDYPTIHFSFSHCPKAVACAISSSPVGLDVEVPAPLDEAVLGAVLSPSEQAAVRASPTPKVAFARLWTRKEALIKLRGDALDECRLPDLLASVQGVTFETRVRPAYVLSVARPAEDP